MKLLLSILLFLTCWSASAHSIASPQKTIQIVLKVSKKILDASYKNRLRAAVLKDLRQVHTQNLHGRKCTMTNTKIGTTTIFSGLYFIEITLNCKNDQAALSKALSFFKEYADLKEKQFRLFKFGLPVQSVKVLDQRDHRPSVGAVRRR